MTIAGLSYVLPLKWGADRALEDLTAYLWWLARRAEVIVVDASPPDVFAAHARAWRGLVTHVPPDDDLRFLNGKVNGVHTGMRRATREAVVIADDDVRYDAESLARVEALLRRYDVVRPQNYFTPLPWHALWDTGRTLLNRATAGDWPGTLGVRRSAYERAGGYDGDVLFENLQLVRTIESGGGTSHTALDVLVARRPPSARTFWSQRVRQAYDELARPAVLVLWLAVIPVALALAFAGRWGALAAIGASIALVAESGRRRAGGRRVFSARASLLAPVWVLERGICAWLAVATRLFLGGVRYHGIRIRHAATRPRGGPIASPSVSGGRRRLA